MQVDFLVPKDLPLDVTRFRLRSKPIFSARPKDSARWGVLKLQLSGVRDPAGVHLLCCEEFLTPEGVAAVNERLGCWEMNFMLPAHLAPGSYVVRAMLGNAVLGEKSMQITPR